jgi:hypothetical protein
MSTAIQPITPDGDDRDFQPILAERVSNRTAQRYPGSGGWAFVGEWPGVEIATDRPVRIAAAWEDEPGGLVTFGATYRYDD